MVDLKAKTILNKKGDEVYLTVNRFLVTLTWTASVDLDLMAFYQTKNGKEGGVFPSHYPGGNLGSLKYFPYLKLNSHPLKTGLFRHYVKNCIKSYTFFPVPYSLFPVPYKR